MHDSYQEDVGLDPGARYLHGTPLRPVVPLDTAIGELFILGAYPSARFALVNGVPDVPIADNLGPFENERWFDGARVREQPSARELRDLFLEPLAVDRGRCWVTDLVKVFLFKPGHCRKYASLGAALPAGYERDRFAELAERSIPWLGRELSVARPRLMISLGREVAGVLHGVASGSAQNRLLRAELVTVRVAGMEVPTMHCAHPGILMRSGPRNPWPDRHRRGFLPALRSALREVARG